VNRAVAVALALAAFGTLGAAQRASIDNKGGAEDFWASFFASRGYVAIAQDTRGRLGSEGVWHMMTDDVPGHGARRERCVLEAARIRGRRSGRSLRGRREPNTGEPLNRHRRMVVATNTIHHDAAHPSHVVLPIVPR
jgi:predicted acyl esterase